MAEKASNSHNYSFPAKQRWREQAWLEVLSRVERRQYGSNIAECTVLYLAGWDNCDLPTATALGVNPARMIAIEAYGGTSKHLRASGQLCVHGELNAVLRNWPHHRKVDVVYADLCAGFELDKARDLLLSIGTSLAFIKSVILVNLQRGRDDAEEVRRLTDGGKHRGRALFALACKTLDDKIGGAWERLAKPFVKYTQPSPVRKNRAFKRLELLERYTGKTPPLLAEYRHSYAAAVDYARRLVSVHHPQHPLHIEAEPEFLSYRGRRVFMDTVVMREMYNGGHGWESYRADKPLARQISAVLANQTRKLSCS